MSTWRSGIVPWDKVTLWPLTSSTFKEAPRPCGCKCVRPTFSMAELTSMLSADGSTPRPLSSVCRSSSRTMRLLNSSLVNHTSSLPAHRRSCRRAAPPARHSSLQLGRLDFHLIPAEQHQPTSPASNFSSLSSLLLSTSNFLFSFPPSFFMHFQQQQQTPPLLVLLCDLLLLLLSSLLDLLLGSVASSPSATWTVQVSSPPRCCSCTPGAEEMCLPQSPLFLWWGLHSALLNFTGTCNFTAEGHLAADRQQGGSWFNKGANVPLLQTFGSSATQEQWGLTGTGPESTQSGSLLTRSQPITRSPKNSPANWNIRDSSSSSTHSAALRCAVQKNITDPRAGQDLTGTDGTNSRQRSRQSTVEEVPLNVPSINVGASKTFKTGSGFKIVEIKLKIYLWRHCEKKRRLQSVCITCKSFKSNSRSSVKDVTTSSGRVRDCSLSALQGKKHLFFLEN